MAVASDNVFPKLILDGVTSAPAAPTNDNWKLYAMPDGLYARSSNTIVGPLGAGGGGAVATDAIWDAAGDLAVGTGANTAARLAIGASGTVPQSNGTTLAYSFPPCYELDRTEKTSAASITATTEGTANTVVTAGAISFDGSTTVDVECFFPYLLPAATANAFIVLVLYDDSSSIGLMASVRTGVSTNETRAPAFGRRRLTPSNATHTYSIRAYVSSGTGTVGAGAGGSGNYMPGYIRIVRV